MLLQIDLGNEIIFIINEGFDNVDWGEVGEEDIGGIDWGDSGDIIDWGDGGQINEDGDIDWGVSEVVEKKVTLDINGIILEEFG